MQDTLPQAQPSLRPPSRDNPRLGMLISALAHAGLIIALTLGVQWRNEEPAGVQAELWAATPQIAAPRAETPPATVPPPPPPPPPRPQPAPTPPPQPVVVKAPPPPPPDTSQRDAEIALEKAREVKLEKARQAAADRRALDKRLKDAQAAKDAQLKQDRLDKEKQDKERQAKLDAEQAKQQQAEKALKAQKAEKAAQAEAQRLKAQREAQLRRMTQQLGGTGAANSTGTAARDAGPSAGYAGRIKARIKPNIVLTDDVPGNPVAEAEVRLAPDGTIIGRRIVKPSGNAAWDETVLRAIDRTAVLPRDTDGRVPSTMIISFKPFE